MEFSDLHKPIFHHMNLLDEFFQSYLKKMIDLLTRNLVNRCYIYIIHIKVLGYMLYISISLKERTVLDKIRGN